ncbi:MAG TPA: S8 family serine peptidase [Verrucomicrobiae bacterium]
MRRTKISAIGFSLAGLFLACLPPASFGDDLVTMGVTLLRASQPSLTGAGIPVAQPEALNSASAPQFEVDNFADFVFQPESLFTWISTNGSTNVIPNNLGDESTHADQVATIFYGRDLGVAPGVAHVNNYEADYFYQYVVVDGAAMSSQVINQSFSFFAAPPDEQPIDSAYDDYIYKYGSIFASAPNGNGNSVSPPGTAYNCIGVSAYGYGAVITQGPTLDNGRSKPDISGPGGDTSYTTPRVAGSAALLSQAGAAGQGGTNIAQSTNAMTIKALLLNGALKPFDWSHTSTAPLDTRFGAGVLNVFNSWKQLAGGESGFTSQDLISPGAAHPPVSSGQAIASPSGWDFQTVNYQVITELPPLVKTVDTVNHYLFNVTNKSTLTATLVWERHEGMANINNLALFLYNATNTALISSSVSMVDNVQHIYLPHLQPGKYDLEAVAYSANSVSLSENYALAFQFFPMSPPGLSVTAGPTNAIITWPLSPTVYTLQSTASLSQPHWTNVTAQEWITNTVMWTSVYDTNGATYFRLVR